MDSLLINGKFLNADSGFDSKDFSAYCVSKDIIGNIAINLRNENNEEYLFLNYYTKRYKLMNVSKIVVEL